MGVPEVAVPLGRGKRGLLTVARFASGPPPQDAAAMGWQSPLEINMYINKVPFSPKNHKSMNKSTPKSRAISIV
jgi:hypothetical protein